MQLYYLKLIAQAKRLDTKPYLTFCLPTPCIDHPNGSSLLDRDWSEQVQERKRPVLPQTGCTAESHSRYDKWPPGSYSPSQTPAG